MDKDYYIYLYIDPRDYQVFYVGKGKGNRKNAHLRPSLLTKRSSKNSRIKAILAAGLVPSIVVVEDHLTHAESLNRERWWISLFGLKNLTNKTSGGQGVAGLKSFLGRKHTEEAKEKIRQSKLGPRNPMYGKSPSAATRLKMSQRMAGKNHPLWGKSRPTEVRQKISDSLSGCEWSEGDKKKRSAGMKKVWEERRKTGQGMPRHKHQMIE